MRWKRRRPGLDPAKLGDLTLWEGAGDEVIWAELPTDAKSAEVVEHIKQMFREHGWRQTVGD